MEGTIKECPNCSRNNIEHVFQDSLYGKFKRVMNPTGKSSNTGFRCTVCKTTTK